jgi:hypothetical protein
VATLTPCAAGCAEPKARPPLYQSELSDARTSCGLATAWHGLPITLYSTFFAATKAPMMAQG